MEGVVIGGGGAPAEERLAALLRQSCSGDEAAVRSAAAALEEAEAALPRFRASLLAVCAVAERPVAVAAAALVKNSVRRTWDAEDAGTAAAAEHAEFRALLLDVLLRARDSAVLHLLAETVSERFRRAPFMAVARISSAAGLCKTITGFCEQANIRVCGVNLQFRVVAAADFRSRASWPDVVPALKVALQASNLMSGMAASNILTRNALAALLALLQPFRERPAVLRQGRANGSRHEAPEQLEFVTRELVLPLHPMFSVLVSKKQQQGWLEHDQVLHLLLKVLHFSMRMYMPASLVPQLGVWLSEVVSFLEFAAAEQWAFSTTVSKSRVKCCKRALQIMGSLITHHQLLANQCVLWSYSRVCVLQPLALLDVLVIHRPWILFRSALYPWHLIPSQSFSRLGLKHDKLQDLQGWRLLVSNFAVLLESSIFPVLRLTFEDVQEWQLNEEEYLAKNLPSDLADASAWKADLYTRRKSALNLLGLIGLADRPPTVSISTKSNSKRKTKGRKAGVTAGEALILPFLNTYPVPPDGADIASDSISNYFGVLLAYGALQEFLKQQSEEKLSALLHARVLPLYTMVSPSPFLLANANWLLGELASALPAEPQELGRTAFQCLVKSLTAQDRGGMSWRLVRSSAAAAIALLVQAGSVKPRDWLPLLQAAVAGAKSDNEADAATSFRLLEELAELGDIGVLKHEPEMVEAIVQLLIPLFPAHPEPWPLAVEAGLSALASWVRQWEQAEEDMLEQGEERSEAEVAVHASESARIADSTSKALQQGWLSQSHEEEADPPPSCLADTSLLLAFVLSSTINKHQAQTRMVEELLQAYSGLLLDWEAWEAEEDLAACRAIKQAITLQKELHFNHLAQADMPPPPAPPIAPRSIAEGMASFLASAIESNYKDAVWRACRATHSLLRACQASPGGDEAAQAIVARLSQVAGKRLHMLVDTEASLGKPLALAIATCFNVAPSAALAGLAAPWSVASNFSGVQALHMWVTAVKGLLTSKHSMLDSELKLIVHALTGVTMYLLNHASASQGGHAEAVAGDACYAAVNSLVKLADLRQLAKNDAMEAEDEGEEDDEVSGSRDEEDIDEDVETDDEDEDEEWEETEEEFQARYAKAAAEVEEELVAASDRPPEEEDDGLPLDLGPLEDQDEEADVAMCLQQCNAAGLLQQLPPPEGLLERLLAACPAVSSAAGLSRRH
eukprot:SM000010S04253  [mRNA]  locus=s10:546148:553203:- [translate_table: standard]